MWTTVCTPDAELLRLQAAAADLDALCARARALARSTAWQARAAERYRGRVAEWVAEVDTLSVRAELLLLRLSVVQLAASASGAG